MNIEKAKRAIKNLAEQKEISEDAIRSEIELAIAESMKSTEIQAQLFWNAIPYKGEKPTPEEVVAYIADMTQK